MRTHCNAEGLGRVMALHSGLQEWAEEKFPLLRRWPLTAFGTMVLIGLLVGLSIGVYECYECYAIRGLE